MPTPEKRFYYGWVIVASGFCTMLLVQGSFASSGVLFAALTEEYGWSRATLSLPFSIALVGYAPLTWLAGCLFDRYGPRRLFPLGALCLTWGVLVGQGLSRARPLPIFFTVRIWGLFSVPSNSGGDSVVFSVPGLAGLGMTTGGAITAPLR